MLDHGLDEHEEAWRNFLLEAAFAKNYSLASWKGEGPPLPNEVVDRLLPSLLHIKAVALLDHALKAWLSIRSDRCSDTLDKRIQSAVRKEGLSAKHGLHSIRHTRNALAHEAAPRIDWLELDHALLTINDALHSLGLAGPMPTFDASVERSAAGEGTVQGALCTYRYKLIIKSGTSAVGMMKWEEHIMRSA